MRAISLTPRVGCEDRHAVARRAGTRRDRRSRRAPGPATPAPRRRGSRPPRSPAPLRRGSRASRTQPGSSASCSSSDSSKTRPDWYGVERLVAVRRHLERVPADEHRARLLGLPEPHDHVREADDRVQRGSTSAARGRRGGRTSRRRRRAARSQRRLELEDLRHQPLGRLMRGFARSRGRAGRRSRPARRTRRASSRAAAACRFPSTAAGTSGTPASSAIRAAPVRGRASKRLTSPFFRRVPSGNITTRAPRARAARRSRSPRRRAGPGAPEMRPTPFRTRVSGHQ